MNDVEKFKFNIRVITAYFITLPLAIIMFLVGPLAFRGPGYDVCNNTTGICTPINTTRWHWLGGYHAVFGDPLKYWPTSTWELWALFFTSLAVATVLYFGGRWLYGRFRTRSAAV